MCRITAPRLVDYGIDNFGFLEMFLWMISRLLIIDTTERRVGEASDNWLNTEGLADKFVITDEVHRAWQIWRRHCLKSKVRVRAIFEEIMVTLHLLVFAWSPSAFLVKQWIINRHSQGLRTWFVLGTLFFYRSDFLRVEASLDTQILASKNFFVPLWGLLSPRALSVITIGFLIHIHDYIILGKSYATWFLLYFVYLFA